ncbi:MFS transporter [Lysinibacillus sp. NPDC097287]|uniref:MFS transporter n=1 Tax=Lysinibacillus sp. NPDC097287 TaxID=3364144 RepID=UPI0037F453FA
MKLNRNFLLLLIGQSLANMGDVLYLVSVISTIFTLTGSATASSFVPFTISTFMFISSLLTPILIGRFNLKWLLAGSQIGKTILLTLLGFLMLELTATNLYVLFIIIACIAFLDGCANPISQSLIPHYVEPEYLLKANGLTETVTQLIQTTMWFLGSMFLIILGAQQLLWIVGGLFVIASLLLSTMANVKHHPNHPNGKIEMIKEGWRTLSNTPVLRKIAKVEFLETIAGTVWIAAILYVFVSEALHVDEKWWGFINGAFFLGLIVGSIYCIKYSAFVEKKIGVFIFGGSLAGFFVTLMFGLNSFPMIALLLSFLVGLFWQLKNIPQQTVIQTSVSTEKLSTVYTSLSAIGTAVFGIGSLIVGMIADFFGVRTVFVVSSVLLAMVSFIIYKNKKIFANN